MKSCPECLCEDCRTLEPIWKEPDGTIVTLYQITCRKCGARGRLGKTEEDAIRLWDNSYRRKTDDEVFENDALAKAVFGLVFTPENTVDICKKIVSIIEHYRQ